MLGRMTDSAFKPGDDVFTQGARGTVIDVRAIPSGKWVFGVEDANGHGGLLHH
jgi:ribosomal protein L2